MEASGLSRSSWYRAIRSGQLEQLHSGVARLHGTPDTAEQRIMAAILAVGRPALASHRSATHLWGVERPRGEPVDVIAVHLDYDDSQGSPYFDLKILCNEEDLAGVPIAMRKRDG